MKPYPIDADQFTTAVLRDGASVLFVKNVVSICNVPAEELRESQLLKRWIINWEYIILKQHYNDSDFILTCHM